MLGAALALLALTRLFEAGMGGSAFTDDEIAAQEWADIYDTVAQNYDPATNVDSARREQQGKDPYQTVKDWETRLAQGDPLQDPAVSVSAALREQIAARRARGEPEPEDPYGDGGGPMLSPDQFDEALQAWALNPTAEGRYELERFIYAYPQADYFDTEEEYWAAWKDVAATITMLDEIQSGYYDPNGMSDYYGEFWVEYPGGGGRQYGDKGGGGGGGGGDAGAPGAVATGPNPAALAYRQASGYQKAFGSPFGSGFLRRRRKRSNQIRNYRLHKAGWIDPYPWIPGTDPEKELFEWLVRRRLYFIFQGQVPELEEGKLATLSVPGFEPDFILPQYRVILDPFSPFHHSLPNAELRDIQKVALYESLGYRYYHPWALAPGLWSFDQDSVNHGRFTTEGMLNQIPELGKAPLPLSAKELPYVGIGYRLGVNLGAGANSVAAANRARVRARELALAR